MLTVVRRGAATLEKPPETVRGYSSRLPWAWDGLCFAVPLNDPTRDSARDLVTYDAPSAAVGVTTWVRDPRGNTALNLGAGDYIEYPDSPTYSHPATELTVYVRMRRAGTTGAWTSVFNKYYSATDPFVTWEIAHGDPVAEYINAQITVGGVATTLLGTVYEPTTADWVSVFLRWRSGEAPRLDILGERGQTLEATTGGSTVTGSLDYATGQPIRLNSYDNTVCYFADYSQAMVWSRRLSDPELQALVADPFGWYSPRRETIGVSSPYPLLGGDSFMREVPSG